MSTQTYALLFYGFPVEDEDCTGFLSWELEQTITDARLGRQVRAVSYGPFDNNSTALAIRKPFVQVEVDSLTPLAAVPKQVGDLTTEYQLVLKAAAAKLGVEYKTPGWYIAPQRF
jgi:hypothetical protein